MDRKSIILITCVIGVILLLGVLVFEIRDVPIVKWDEKYSYKDEEANGLYVFKELADRYYEDVTVEILTEYKEEQDTNGLYIYISRRTLYGNTLDSVLSIAGKGNDVILMSGNFPYDLNDTIDSYFETEYQYADKIQFSFAGSSLAEDTFNLKFFDKELLPLDSFGYNLLVADTDYDFYKKDIIVEGNDSLALMVKFPIGEGNVYYHVVPQLFFNHSYRQSEMFRYTEQIFRLFDPQYVNLIENWNFDTTIDSRNPLQYIMSSPPLKAAYYTLLLGALLYGIFGGKRKQKAIPIADKNENTSLEYIETVSQLFYQQDQHEKLVAHIRKIFYHKMEKRFFIKKDHPEYLATLTKKSKIPEAELKYVLDRFQNLDDKYTFKGEQLESLNARIEKIYKFLEKDESKRNT